MSRGKSGSDSKPLQCRCSPIGTPRVNQPGVVNQRVREFETVAVGLPATARETESAAAKTENAKRAAIVGPNAKTPPALACEVLR